MSEEIWSFLEEFRYHSGNTDNVPLLQHLTDCVAEGILPDAFLGEVPNNGKDRYTVEDLVMPVGPEETTALHCACANGCLENAKFLVDTLGAKIHVNANGNTPLHWAAQNGHAEIVQWLTERFPDLDVLAKNAFGRSALAMAFESQNEGCVVAVLNHSSASQLVPPEEREEEACEFRIYQQQRGTYHTDTSSSTACD